MKCVQYSRLAVCTQTYTVQFLVHNGSVKTWLNSSKLFVISSNIQSMSFFNNVGCKLNISTILLMCMLYLFQHKSTIKEYKSV